MIEVTFFAKVAHEDTLNYEDWNWEREAVHLQLLDYTSLY